MIHERTVKVNLDLRVSKDLAFLLRRLVRNIVMGLWVMALLISSSIICTTDMTPKFMGIPALGAFGYLMAVVIMIYVFVKHIFSRKSKKEYKAKEKRDGNFRLSFFIY